MADQERNGITRRDLMKGAGASLALLFASRSFRAIAGGGEPALPEPSPTPTIEGSTILGPTLEIGVTSLTLNSISGEELALRIGAKEKGWKIVTDNQGNSSFFSGLAGYNNAEGNQVAVLTQGPPNSVWDGINKIWSNGAERTVPDVLLPGGYNEDTKKAGPARFVERVFLFLDKEGNYRVGIIYPRENVYPDDKNVFMEIFPDGSALRFGDHKNFKLEPGQKIVRDDDCNLRLTNTNGSYRLMRTSWENVTSADQTYQAGAFAGPIFDLSEIPYIQDTLLNTTIASARVAQYAKTFGLDAEQIVKEDIMYSQEQGVSGPFLVIKTKASGIPLFIAEKGKSGEWFWKKANFKEIANQKGVDMGVLLMPDEPDSAPIEGEQFNFGTASFAWSDFIKDPKILFGSNYEDPNFSWSDYFKKPGAIDFAWIDYQAKFARDKGMKTKLNHILCPADMPEWLKEGVRAGSINKDMLLDIMKNGIREIMKHGKGIGITEWSVVNEPYDREDRKDDIFHQLIGEDYIDIAFETAREADRSAILIFNDCNNHTSGGESGRLTQNTLQIVKRLREKNLIDKVGLQMHINEPNRPPAKGDVIKVMKGYGIPVEVTEFDIQMDNYRGTEAQKIKKEAEITQSIFEAAMESGVCNSFTVWGLSDANPWEPGRRVLFDKEYNPKPAYFALLKILLNLQVPPVQSQ